MLVFITFCFTFRYCVSTTRDGIAAVLVCEEEPEPFHKIAPRTVCSFISVFFLTLTIIVYILVSELRDLQVIFYCFINCNANTDF